MVSIEEDGSQLIIFCYVYTFVARSIGLGHTRFPALFLFCNLDVVRMNERTNERHTHTHETCRVFVMANLLQLCILFCRNFRSSVARQYDDCSNLGAKANYEVNSILVALLLFYFPLISRWCIPSFTHKNSLLCYGMLHDLCQIWIGPLWRWLLWMKMELHENDGEITFFPIPLSLALCLV